MSGRVRTVDCFLTVMSPWAYIGHAVFAEIGRRHGVAARYRPVSLSTVFPATGGLPLAERHPARQSYRMLELQRWREHRGLSFNLRPRFWPYETALADRAVVALDRAGRDPETFLRAAFAGTWEEERDLADPGEIGRLLGETGHHAAAVMAAAASDEIGEAYAAQTRAALDAGVFGSPSYVLDGEVFWGQDRLASLDDALTSGRSPFRA